ncbi:hypothetical protein C8F04DRAFT_1271649 [Mycena alexandri]|uniref:RING-type domain-containing protein n=1 Tax=Mycena alexandri TaxID=1745969 RepID=A0AAD6S8L1_9AGAR|nr:hypothetical protein C8F04DRAFT_1271649 [Mycena alexandri]
MQNSSANQSLSSHPALLAKSAAELERIRRAIGDSTTSPDLREIIRQERRARGDRTPRDSPLTEDDLFIGIARPPTLRTDRAHWTCSLCSNVKAHPVAYTCGHSHCFVCIRLHLERSWKCPLPDCAKLMRQPPHRIYSEEQGIAYDFPHWDDPSVVSYSWDGLTFPRPLIFSDDE